MLCVATVDIKGLGALIVVSIPRLSSYIGTGNEREYAETASTILNSLITLAVPVMVGTFALSDKIVFLLSGKDFLPATTSLQILSVALLFSIFSWFYTSCVLIVNTKNIEASVKFHAKFAESNNLLLANSIAHKIEDDKLREETLSEISKDIILVKKENN